MPRVLIVDDEDVIRQTVIDILEYEGYELDTAADGALLELLESTATKLKFLLLFLKSQ